MRLNVLVIIFFLTACGNNSYERTQAKARVVVVEGESSNSEPKDTTNAENFQDEESAKIEAILADSLLLDAMIIEVLNTVKEKEPAFDPNEDFKNGLSVMLKDANPKSAIEAAEVFYIALEVYISSYKGEDLDNLKTAMTMSPQTIKDALTEKIQERLAQL